MNDVAATAALVRERLGHLLEGEGALSPLPNDDLRVRVAPAGLPAAAAILREELGFTTLMNHLGVDHGDRMAVVYNLRAPATGAKVALTAVLDREAPAVASLQLVYPGVVWFERETWDLLGILFHGHRGLRRLLLPEDWVGHPLRKDYAFPERYAGLDLRRPDPLATPPAGQGA